MKIIGHRGAKGLAPENTLASFKKALEYGVDELEFDVRVTKDAVVILSHNAFLTNPAGSRLAIRDYTYAELKLQKPDLTTFDEVLDFADHRLPLYVEVKPHEPLPPIVKIIQKRLELGWRAQDFRLGSYSQPSLRALHAVFPEIQKVVIENWSSVRATWRARQVCTKRISMLELWLWPGFIRAMNHRGWELYAFPPKTARKERFFARLGLAGRCNNPLEASLWAKAGLAGIITDYPDRFE